MVFFQSVASLKAQAAVAICQKFKNADEIKLFLAPQLPPNVDFRLKYFQGLAFTDLQI